jgi:hypothetical protein
MTKARGVGKHLEHRNLHVPMTAEQGSGQFPARCRSSTGRLGGPDASVPSLVEKSSQWNRARLLLAASRTIVDDRVIGEKRRRPSDGCVRPRRLRRFNTSRDDARVADSAVKKKLTIMAGR